MMVVPAPAVPGIGWLQRAHCLFTSPGHFTMNRHRADPALSGLTAAGARWRRVGPFLQLLDGNVALRATEFVNRHIRLLSALSFAESVEWATCAEP